MTKSSPPKALFLLFPLCFLAVRSGAIAQETNLERQLSFIVSVLGSIVDNLAAEEVFASVEPIFASEEPVLQTDLQDKPMSSAELEANLTDSIAPISPYKLTVIDPEGVDPTSVVVLLHGINSSVAEVLPIVQIARSVLSKARFVLPHAPVKLVGFAEEEIAAWYNIPSLDANTPEAVNEIKQASQNIADVAMIQQLELGIGFDKVALVGVDQGGGVALTAYLRYKWAGVVTLSAYLPIIETYPAELTADSAMAPLLMMHGSADEVVPPFVAESSADFIKGLGRTVQYIEFEGEDHKLGNDLDRIFAAATTALQAVLL